MVIIDNLNIRWAGIVLRPLKTNSPLVIDPNGMLSLAVSLQGFQTVGVERGKITERRSGIENPQTLLSLAPERLALAGFFAGCEALGVLVTVAPYHPGSCPL